jgi:hypothetical protein
MVPFQAFRLAAQQPDAAKAASVFQAVYIYNFTRYVYFPPAKNSGDFIIGVLGKTDVGSSLERTATVKKAGLTGQPIRVILYDSPVAAMKECHFVYISEKYTSRVAQIAGMLKGQPTLLITEGEGVAKGVPAISMVSNAEKKFQVNNKMIEESSLKVSADFLRFALVVQ